MKLLSDKKGVSPLFATLLLVLLSVSLGAVVMSLGETYIGERANFVKGIPEVGFGCELVGFSITKIRGVEHICVRDNSIDISIDNNPNVAIDDFHARIYGMNGISNVQNLLYQPLEKYSGVRLIIPYDNIGIPLKVTLTPIKNSNSDVIYCSEKAVMTENLPPCQ